MIGFAFGHQNCAFPHCSTKIACVYGKADSYRGSKRPFIFNTILNPLIDFINPLTPCPGRFAASPQRNVSLASKDNLSKTAHNTRLLRHKKTDADFNGISFVFV